MHNTSSAQTQKCIDDCIRCYQTCLQMAMNHCLELGGKHVEPQHFRSMITCSEICRTAADFMLSSSPLHVQTCAVCAQVCDDCARSCEQVGDMDLCVQACRQCAESCREMAGGASYGLQGSRAGTATA
ncbi:MAG: four-helix bundle copper-binding protein [Rhodospirillaceae bacterium]